MLPTVTAHLILGVVCATGAALCVLAYWHDTRASHRRQEAYWATRRRAILSMARLRPPR